MSPDLSLRGGGEYDNGIFLFTDLSKIFCGKVEGLVLFFPVVEFATNDNPGELDTCLSLRNNFRRLAQKTRFLATFNAELVLCVWLYRA